MGLFGRQSRVIEGQQIHLEFRTLSTAILLLVMFQAGTMYPTTPPRVQMSQVKTPAAVSPDFAEEPPADEAADEEREFIRRLSGLSRALSAFAETYKRGQVDLKKVNAVRKAMHELEKSEWFRLQKPK
jgi:hypothetical protein